MDDSTWSGFLFYFPFFYAPKNRMNILWRRYTQSGKTAMEFFEGYVGLGLAEGLTASAVLDAYVESLLDAGLNWMEEHGDVHVGVIRGLLGKGAEFPEERLTAPRFAGGFVVDIYEEVAGYDARAYLIDRLWANLKKVRTVVDWRAYEGLSLESLPVVGMSREWMRLNYLKYLSHALMDNYGWEEGGDEDEWKENYREWMMNR
jgi:hypothetical protein